MSNLGIDVSISTLASAYLRGPFDEGKAELEKEGYRIISLQENAMLRMQEGKSAFISQYGNYTREGVIYVPKKGIYLTKNSPIMENAEEATDCHGKGEEFYLNKKQVEKALSDSIELSVNSIPTGRFGDDKITAYAFGDIAEQYGNFLKNAGLSSMLIYKADIRDKPFAKQIWFRYLGFGRLDFNLGSRSELDCNNWLNIASYWVRGVREAKASEVGSKNLKDLYSKEQISEALKKANLSGIEKVLLEKLSK